MMKIIHLFILFFVLSTSLLKAQIEDVIVERYYITDRFDTTDITSGGIQEGDTTFRIFLDLAPGYKVKKIMGLYNHPLEFKTTGLFHNNLDRGESFGFDLRKSRLDENIVALDSRLTIGFATKELIGIPKTYDTDGSIEEFLNNDGGSEEIEGGLLQNSGGEMGSALSISDGLIENLDTLLNDYINIGFTHPTLGDTIFDDETRGNIFSSIQANLVHSTGIFGPTPENFVLLAILTTGGELTFKLNVELIDSMGNTVIYVANKENRDIDNDGVMDYEYNRFLNFPPKQPECGCKDPYYIEFNKEFECHVQDSCKEEVVLGCMDKLACNYDSIANFNIKELCCYGPDRCDNRNIEIVCPDYLKSLSPEISLYPNPAKEQFNILIKNAELQVGYIQMYNAHGDLIKIEDFYATDIEYTHTIGIENFQSGLYLVKVEVEKEKLTHTLIIK